MKLFTIGCSFTEGQELENHKTECYPHLLSKKLELEYFNFGATGMSNDYIFRKIFELINSNTLTKNDILIIQWTHYLRKELPVSYNKHQWYHTIPNSFHAYNDKVIIDEIKIVQDMYCGKQLLNDRLKIESNNKTLLEDYILHFLDKTYQINTTKNYINSMYTYLEYFGYKHIHFFGWNNCIVESMHKDKFNFLKKSFGAYTNTKENHHPNKEGHAHWCNFLYKKIKELKYDDTFKTKLNNYKNDLHKLKTEIENDIEYTNNKLIEENIIEFENKMQKIRKEKEDEIQKQIKEDTEKLEALKEEIKIKIQIEKEKLKFMNKPKTLI